MIVQLFRNLADYKWLIAIGLLFIMFYPANVNTSISGQEHSVLLNTWKPEVQDFESGLFSRILAVSLILIVAVSYHYILIRHKLLAGRNFIGLFYSVLFISTFPQLFPTFPEILSSALILLAVLPIFASEDSDQPLLRVFDSSFLISIACLVDLHMLPFALIPFIALVLFRQINPKIWASALTGLSLPQIFMLSGLYVFDLQSHYSGTFTDFFSQYSISLRTFALFTIPFAVMAPFMILSLLRMVNALGEKKIVVRKKIVLLIWIFMISFLLLMTQDAPVGAFSMLLLMNLGFFMTSSLRFLYEKRLFVIMTDLAVPALVIMKLL